MAILSVLTPAELASAIMASDKAMVSRADGVGPKLAQRVVNELAEKIGRLPGLATGFSGGVSAGDGIAGVGAGGDAALGDAMSALLNLGYGRQEAHGALLRARQRIVDANGKDDVSALIAGALQEMGS